MREKQADMQKIYDRHVAMWTYYVDELWSLLNNVDPDLPVADQADQVEEKAKQFVGGCRSSFSQ